MTQRISEVQHVIPAEAGIQNAVPALIEKLRIFTEDPIT